MIPLGMPEAAENPFAGLTGLQVDRSSAAQQVADAMRSLIMRGELRPGQPLPEASLASLLGMSRNTVREAFRLLGAEGLVAYQVHRGVVVRRLTSADIADIYAARRVLEVSALGMAVRPAQLDGLRDAVDAAEAAAAQGDWAAVATSNLQFHQHIVALIGSSRLDAFFAGMLAQLRLAYASVTDEAAYFGPYVAENRDLYELLAARNRKEAVRRLQRYLDRSGPATQLALEAAERVQAPA
jgi:DNA-binding GntR family transcriptional regulator